MIGEVPGAVDEPDAGVTDTTCMGVADTVEMDDGEAAAADWALVNGPTPPCQAAAAPPPSTTAAPSAVQMATCPWPRRALCLANFLRGTS